MIILLSPHSDDAVLFASYIIQRKKPLVVTVTRSTLQGNNGDERYLEDTRAMKILKAPICFLGIDEDKLTEELLREKLKTFCKDSQVYVPEYEENGNPHHNLVSKVAKQLFKTKEYKTYTGLEDRTIGKEIIPTEQELALKKQAMACYNTQIENPITNHYFNTTKEYE